MTWTAFLSLVLVSATIKLGGLAPEGSSYMNIANEMKKEIEDRTGGNVKIIWYGGGVMGDEPEMVRKIRVGQLHGGGFTGYGLGLIEESIRVLELPGLFKSYDEFFETWKHFESEFKDAFRKKGYELLAYFPVGFVYVFSKDPIRKLEDLKGVRLWVWAGDPVAAEVAKSLQGYAQLISISLSDVLTSLQTGMINAFYNMPYGAMALQWTKYVKYMLDFPITLASGGVVISEKALKNLKDEERKVVFETAEKYFKKASQIFIDENRNAIKQFSKEIQILQPSDRAEVENFVKTFKKSHEAFKGKLYSAELYDRIVSHIENLRKSKSASK
jgi:TRAP-type C4-dicarboxylate transport system substrate-binding protein